MENKPNIKKTTIAKKKVTLIGDVRNSVIVDAKLQGVTTKPANAIDDINLFLTGRATAHSIANELQEFMLLNQISLQGATPQEIEHLAQQLLAQ